MNYFNYFTEIEDTFIRRRGRHLLLSPTDWALIENWRKMGVPLHIALRGIEQSFDSFQAKPRQRTVKTLFYCQEEVEAQFAEWVTAQQGAAPTDAGTPPDDDAKLPRTQVLAHLQRAAAALRAVSAPAASPLGELVHRAALAVDELAQDFARAARPDAEGLEQSLNAWEQRLDEVLCAALTTAEMTEATAAAAAPLVSYRRRMDAAVYEQTLQTLLLKQLRERAGVPRLSLFYL